MLLTYNDLKKLCFDGVIEGVPGDNINGASIDVTLGPDLLVEDVSRLGLVDLERGDTLPTRKMSPRGDGSYLLYPGSFVLAATQEKFHLPGDIACQFLLKSSLARCGLNHALATWGDPWWHSSVLTLELQNILSATTLLLRPGMKIGQIVFWRGEEVPWDRGYGIRGKYNNDNTVSESKGLS